MDSESRYDALRALLRARAEEFPAPLRRLGNALWNQTDEPLSHAECLEQLPEFIDAELAGEAMAKRLPRVKHHLDQCDACSAEYAELLETEWAEQRGALARPTNMPRPNLDFLPQPIPALSDVVLQLAQQLIAVINPARARELSVIAATFFEQARGLGDDLYLRSSPAPALNLGRGEISDGLKTLAGTYAATQALVREVTRRQAQEWQQQAILAAEIETRARAAAQAIGLDNSFAARLAREYAPRIAADPAPLLALLKHE